MSHPRLYAPWGLSKKNKKKDSRLKKLWLNNYPPQVPGDLPPLDKSMVQLFDEACTTFKDKSAFVSFNKHLSYRELKQQSCYMAGYLQSEGFKKGDVVAIMLPNVLQYPISLWAVILSSLTVLNLNPLLSARELLTPLNETSAKGIIMLSSQFFNLKSILHKTQLKTVILTSPGDMLDIPKKQIINTVFRFKTKDFNFKNKHSISFLKALKKGQKNQTPFKKTKNQDEIAVSQPVKKIKNQDETDSIEARQHFQKTKESTHKEPQSQPPAQDITNQQNQTSAQDITNQQSQTSVQDIKGEQNQNPKAPFLIQYTGGTTGVAKGVLLSEKNILSNIKQTQLWTLSFLKKDKEKALAALPFCHIFALMVNGMTFFFSGWTNILIANPKKLSSLIKTIKKQKPTVGTGVNTLFKALLAHKEFKKLDFSNLKLFVSGGMSLQPSVLKQWQQLTNSSLIEGYGLTEASPVVCCDRLDRPSEGRVGFPLPSTNIRIVNNQGLELDIEQEGELEVKGPQVMEAYYKQDKETKLVLNSKGWLKTGDIAKVNAQGLVTILGRKKDMINISGFKVYPNELEELLISYPKVKEVGVTSAKNKQGDEIVKAFIVKSQSSCNEKELKNYCKKHLAPYKIPKQIVFTSSIPKNMIGKPITRLLKNKP